MNFIQQKIKKLLLSYVLFATLSLIWMPPLAANDVLYGTVAKLKYLMGDYPREGSLKVFTNKIEKNTHALREDTIDALNRMIDAYDKDREGKSKQHIFIVLQCLISAMLIVSWLNTHRSYCNLQHKIIL